MIELLVESSQTALSAAAVTPTAQTAATRLNIKKCSRYY